jgi:hypothetical protein
VSDRNPLTRERVGAAAAIEARIAALTAERDVLQEEVDKLAWEVAGLESQVIEQVDTVQDVLGGTPWAMNLYGPGADEPAAAVTVVLSLATGDLWRRRPECAGGHEWAALAHGTTISTWRDLTVDAGPLLSPRTGLSYLERIAERVEYGRETDRFAITWVARLPERLGLGPWTHYRPDTPPGRLAAGLDALGSLNSPPLPLRGAIAEVERLLAVFFAETSQASG